MIVPSLRNLDDDEQVSIPGRAGKIRSLTLVLEGNNPRFPREPSATTLTYRLAGTTEESVSNRDTHHHRAHRAARNQPTQDRDPQRNLREPRRDHQSLGR